MLIIILIIVIIVCISVFSMATLGLNSNQNASVNTTNVTTSLTVDHINQETSGGSSQGESESQHKSTADLAREWSGTSDGRVSDVISDGDKSKADYLNSQIDHSEGNRVYYKDGSSAEFVDKS